MSGLEGKITMSTCEGRPCWVKGRRAIFHRWTDSARPVKPASNDQETDERMQKWSVHGLVEYEDGTVDREWPNSIRFADSPEHFATIAWEGMEARRDACDHEERVERTPGTTEPAPELKDICDSCKHLGAETSGECEANDFDCIRCTAGCICADCTLGDKWEPKEAGAV